MMSMDCFALCFSSTVEESMARNYHIEDRGEGLEECEHEARLEVV